MGQSLRPQLNLRLNDVTLRQIAAIADYYQWSKVSVVEAAVQLLAMQVASDSAAFLDVPPRVRTFLPEPVAMPPWDDPPPDEAADSAP